MGAEPWGHFVPYQPDIAAALEALRQDVFDRGAYQKPIIDLDFLDQIGFFEASDAEREEMFAQYGLDPLRAPLERVGLGNLRQWLLERSNSPTLRTGKSLTLCRRSASTAVVRCWI